MSRGPANTDEYVIGGQNKLECRTCPYQFAIERRYYERKEMKRKEVEDVMGGKDAWANVDKTDGEFFCHPVFLLKIFPAFFWREREVKMPTSFPKKIFF